MVADEGEDEVVEALAAPKADETGEEKAAGHVGDGDEGTVVGSRVRGESGCDPKEKAGAEAGEEVVGGDAVGGALAVDFDEEVAEDVGNGEDDDAAVDG